MREKLRYFQLTKARGVHYWSVSQFSCSVVSDSLWPHELQHTRLPCPSPTPGAYSNSCPSSRWCQPTISTFVVPFSSRLQSFPALGSFPVSPCIRWPKYWSFNFSISPSTEYSGLISFRIDWLDLLAVQGISRVFSRTAVQKQQFLGSQRSLWSNSHLYTWLLEKTLECSLDCKEIKSVSPGVHQSWIFVGKTDAEIETPILWPPDARTHWKRP